MATARWVLVLLLALCLLGTPAPAGAEPFVDAFAGVTFTPKNDVDVRLGGVRADTTSDFEDSFSVGARAGYWLGFFGINLDVSYFRPELDPDEATVNGTRVDTETDVIGLGLNAMLRGQFLRDRVVPQGRLQPYIFGGPTLFFSRFEGELSGAGSGKETDVSTKLGVTAGGGLAYLFTPLLGVFAEYRFTYNRPEFDLDGLRIKPDLDSHHALVGLTLRF
jgi:opacity protein-like surface antigen